MNQSATKMIVKIHPTQNGNIIAICDSELLGRVFEEGEKSLDLSASFYQGDEMSVNDILELLKDAYIVNAVGTDSVELVLKNNLVKKGNIRKISGVPYAQCVVECYEQ